MGVGQWQAQGEPIGETWLKGSSDRHFFPAGILCAIWSFSTFLDFFLETWWDFNQFYANEQAETGARNFTQEFSAGATNGEPQSMERWANFEYQGGRKCSGSNTSCS